MYKTKNYLRQTFVFHRGLFGQLPSLSKDNKDGKWMNLVSHSFLSYNTYRSPLGSTSLSLFVHFFLTRFQGLQIDVGFK